MIIDDIALTLIQNVGPKTTTHLINCFGSAQNIFNASWNDLTNVAKLRNDIAKNIIGKSTHKSAENELNFCRKNNIIPIPSTSDIYPELLRECNDYPHVIYYKGDIGALTKNMIAMVGTRKITAYGHKICEKLIAEIAQAFPNTVIVSGLAFGVDAACHRAALAENIPTIAVLADTLAAPVYPPQHQLIAEKMIENGGGIMSEYHSGHKNKGVTFIPRNRIIAAMGMATIVVESPLKGGAMITANMADGYNRCLMAVPGRVGDNCSEGTNELIKSNKARMLCSAADIARELTWEMNTPQNSKQNVDSLSKDAAGLLNCLPDGESMSLDEITLMTGLSASELAAIILELEFGKFIKVLPGKIYEKN